MPAETRYRAGLVGAGYISEYHVAALRRLPQVELVGIFDVDPARAAHIAETHGLRAFPSMEALRQAGADVMHVLTPPHTHADVCLAALNLGCHVLVEKPLVVDVDDCEKIERVAREKDLRVCVNHSLLYDPQVRCALEQVRQGRLGRVVSVDILRSSVYPDYRGGPLPPQYRTAGYPFRDLGVHALYLFQAFLGPIEHVHADWSSLGGDPNLAFDEWRAHVRCRDGLGQVQLSWNVKPLQHQIIIQGTRGVLRVDLFLMFHARRASTPLPKPIERVVNALTDSVKPLVDVPRNVLGFLTGKIRPYHGLQDLVAAFYRSLESGAPVPVTVDEAKPVIRWTEEIARSADADYAVQVGKVQQVPSVQLAQCAPVLVTGASGALGSALVGRLRASGIPVRQFVRRMPPAAADGTEYVIGNLGDPEAVDRAVRGAACVIHVGAAMKGGWDEHYGATVVGTRNVLEACRKHEVAKLVHISSLSVIDWAGGGLDTPITEATPLEPRATERGAYTRAKLEAEQLVSQYARDHQLPVVLLRPGQIFGGKIPLLTPAVARRAGKRWLMLGSGNVRLPLVYIDDVVDAILLAANSDLRGGEVIQIVDPETFTQNDVLRMVLDPQARVIRVPRALVFAGGKVSELLLGLVKRQSPLSVYRLRSALARRRFESLYAHASLGWEPNIGVCEGIRRERERLRS